MFKKKFWLNSFTIAILLTFISILIYRFDFQLFHLWELKSYDIKVRTREARPVSEQIVIVAIDEKSLKEYGRWPWPRTLMAQLVDRLSEAGSAVIGFDIFFPEKDVYVPFQTVKESLSKKDLTGLNNKNLLKWLEEASNSDKYFAEAIMNSERTVLGFFVYSARDKSGEGATIDPAIEQLLPFFEYSIVQRFDDPQNPVPLRQIGGIGLSIPELSGAASSSGFVSFVPEVDGVVRWIPMVMQYKNSLFPPLSMQVLQQASQTPIGVRIAPYGVESIMLGESLIPTNEMGDFLINYYGPAFTFKHISAADVLSGNIKAEELQNKIVLVGGTAAGIHDIHTTPYGPLFPGTEIQATLIENIIQGDYLIRPDWLTLLDLVMIILSGLLIGVASQFFGALITTLFVLVSVAGYLVMDFYIFTNMGLWVNSIYPVFTQLFVYTGTTLWKYIYEEKQKRFIQKAFAKYLSPVMVEELVKNPELLKSGGEEKIMTVTFSDLAGFTTISERLSNKELAKHMNDYFTEMTDIILKEKGTVTQYAGDMVMAVFGAPVSLPDHAHRAVKVATKMRRRLNELNKIWEKKGLPELGVRTGVNTDRMFFGNLGSQQVFYYSVLGDSVNTAARLESANKQYGTNIMISENTLLKLKEGVFRTRLLDIVQVKGKTKAVKIHDVYGETNIEMKPEELKYYQLYSEGFEQYLSRNFDTAKKTFDEALVNKPGDLAATRMSERVVELDASTLPADWDGTFVMKTK